MKKYLIAALALAALMTSCNSNTWDVTSDLSVDKVDPTQGLTPLAQDPGMDYAPLYWSVYGALRQQEKDGSFPNIFTEKDWDEAIDFVATKLKPYGYDMLVTDGFAAMGGDNGYMTRYSRSPRSSSLRSSPSSRLRASSSGSTTIPSGCTIAILMRSSQVLTASLSVACATIPRRIRMSSTPRRMISSAGCSPITLELSSTSRPSSSTTLIWVCTSSVWTSSLGMKMV